MIVLADGPMAGEYPWSHPGAQEPTHLRAVLDPRGGRFILDQPQERPQDDETLLIYQRNGQPFTAITCGRRSRAQSGPVRIAQYHLLTGIDSEPLRDPDAWQEWSRNQPPLEHPRPPGLPHTSVES